MVRSNIAAAFSIPTRQDPETEARQAEIRGAKLAKRKKASLSSPCSAFFTTDKTLLVAQ